MKLLAQRRGSKAAYFTLIIACFCLFFPSGCFPDSQGNEPQSPRSAVKPAISVRARVDEREAARAFDAVNAQRLAADLTPLVRRRELDDAAYQHALDLVRMGQLSHVSSNGALLEQRLGHLRWIWAGENLARNAGFDDPVAEAVRGWLNSPLHRANMLRPDFSLSGMAAVREPVYGFIYFVQVFIVP